MDLIKYVITQCPICQYIKHRSLPCLVKGQLACGKLPRRIWKIDYIGPLILDKRIPVCKYYSGYTYSGYLASPLGKSIRLILVKHWK